MTDERLILLVKLYNRLSFYFCLADNKKYIPEITENTSIKELQEFLDDLYNKYIEKEKEEEAKLKNGVKIKFIKDTK